MIFSIAHRFGYLLILYGSITLIASSYVTGEIEGQVRIADSGKKGTGRVEIYHENQWGTICNDFWDLNDATVVCQELGYQSALRAFLQPLRGEGPIWLDNVFCDGIEANLTDCDHNGWGLHNCRTDHSEDAAVECQVEGTSHLKQSFLYNIIPTSFLFFHV